MRGYPTIDTPVKIHRVDYKGRKITAPYRVSQNHLGPGYTIDGSILESGFAPNHVSTAMEPDQPKQKHRNWNGYVLYGWRTQREARAAMEKHLGTRSGGKRRKNANAPRCSRCGRQTRKSVSGLGYFCTSKRCGEYTSAPSTSSRLGALVSDINKLTR